MDSKRRHDLETNDLKDFFDNFKDFWDKHGNKVLIVLIVALLAYAGPKYYANWQKGKANDASVALENATSADALLAIAEEHTLVSDEARRRAADLLFGEAREAKIAGEMDAAEKAWSRAKSAYTNIAQQGQTVAYQLVGYEGLAKIALEQGEFDESKKHYEKVIELAGETYMMYAARAKKQIELLPALSSPVAFSPPKPVGIDPLTPGGGTGLPGTSGFDPVIPGLNLPDITNPVPALPPAVTPQDPPAPADPAE